MSNVNPQVAKIVENSKQLMYPFPNSLWRSNEFGDVARIVPKAGFYNVSYKKPGCDMAHMGLSTFNEKFTFIGKAHCVVCDKVFNVTSTELQAGKTNCNKCSEQVNKPESLWQELILNIEKIKSLDDSVSVCLLGEGFILKQSITIDDDKIYVKLDERHRIILFEKEVISKLSIYNFNDVAFNEINHIFQFYNRLPLKDVLLKE